MRKGAQSILIIADGEEAPPPELLRSDVLHQVVYAPLSRPDLRRRTRWLSEAERARRTRKPSEADLTTARLSNAGRIAAFLAHETRNALSYAWANAQYVKKTLQSGVSGDQEIVHAAVDLEEGVSRALGAARTVLELARCQKLECSPLDLNDVTERTVRLLTAKVHNGARCEVQLAPVPAVLADASALAQVITNLVLNAKDAAGARGQVRITTAREDDAVAVCIADSGKGLTPSAQKRLFEPFKTSKKNGGTGLGLAISKWLVESMGGSLVAVRRGALGGAEFRVLLRVAPSA